MAIGKQEFRPDKTSSGILNKLYLTKKQRLSILKWSLYALVLLVLSLVQDVVLSRGRNFAVTSDLVPCAIILICLTEGSHKGSIFTIIAASVYTFSNSGAGYYCIPLLTAAALVFTMFRESYLQKGFATTVLCLLLALTVYELGVFSIGLILSLTFFGRWYAFCLTALLSMLSVPVLYPTVRSISKIGGETWKE